MILLFATYRFDTTSETLAGAGRPVIAAIIPIDQAREAFEKLDGRAGRGKIILNI